MNEQELKIQALTNIVEAAHETLTGLEKKKAIQKAAGPEINALIVFIESKMDECKIYRCPRCKKFTGVRISGMVIDNENVSEISCKHCWNLWQINY